MANDPTWFAVLHSLGLGLGGLGAILEIVNPKVWKRLRLHLVGIGIRTPMIRSTIALLLSASLGAAAYHYFAEESQAKQSDNIIKDHPTAEDTRPSTSSLSADQGERRESSPEGKQESAAQETAPPPTQVPKTSVLDNLLTEKSKSPEKTFLVVSPPANSSTYKPGVETISVKDSGLTGEIRSYKIDKLANDIGVKIFDWVAGSVARSNRVKLVDRSQLESLIAEQALATTEVFDESSTVKLGKLKIADLIVTSEITRCDFSIGQPNQITGNNRACACRIEVNIRVLHTATSIVCYQGTFKGKGVLLGDEDRARELNLAIEDLSDQLKSSSEELASKLEMPCEK